MCMISKLLFRVHIYGVFFFKKNCDSGSGTFCVSFHFWGDSIGKRTDRLGGVV